MDHIEWSGPGYSNNKPKQQNTVRTFHYDMFHVILRLSRPLCPVARFGIQTIPKLYRNYYYSTQMRMEVWTRELLYMLLHCYCNKRSILIKDELCLQF